MVIEAIQHWNGEKWYTIYLSSFSDDVLDTYFTLLHETKATLRMVSFGVSNYDFIATHARDFEVVHRAPTGL